MKKTILLLLLSLFILESPSAQPFNITATRDFNGEFASGTYQIYRSRSVFNISLSNLRKPLILVEGFDPSNDYGFDPNGEDPKTIDLYSLFDRSNTNLSTKIHNEGYDIIILNFENGGDYIQKNAMLLVDLIASVNSQKPTSDPLVVVGYSMGGLVARYALTYMEKNGLNHETSLYVSFDSPHKGAHVPLGLQALAKTFDSDLALGVFPDLASVLKQFNTPAAKQMLKYRITQPTESTGYIPVNSDHLEFIEELENLNECNGFPTTCRNIGISLGSWNGTAQRSNLNIDDDPLAKDFQYASFPTLHINIPQGGSSSDLIYQLNTCEAISTLSFQISVSTSHSDNYPYSDERSDYAELGKKGYATYLYENSGGPLSLFFPSGSYQRVWGYGSEDDTEQMDFAPGAFTPIYNKIVSALNTQIDCHKSFADNSTFIPTVSALAYDTDDLFHDIEGDLDRLQKTPFDNIYGISGDNTSHMIWNSHYSQVNSIVADLISEIQNDYGQSCLKEIEILNGPVDSGENVTIEGVNNIQTSYAIKNGAEVNLSAGSSIKLLPGFSAKFGSEFSAKIKPCVAKPCSWQPSTISLKSASINQKIDTNLVINTVPLINTNINNKDLSHENKHIKIYPNPNDGNFQIYTTIEKGRLQIVNSFGIIVYKQNISFGYNEINIDEPIGIYQVIVFDKDNNAFNGRFIKQ